MLRKVFLLVALTLMTVTTMVQAQVTTASLSGKITADGEAVIGATIQATHVPSGTRYGTITNMEGRYVIQGMRAGGPYKVEISYVGYQNETFNGIQLTLGDTYPLNVTLKESTEVLEEVLVVAKAGMSNTGAAMRFNADDIQRTPTVSRSIGDVTRMNPLVSVSSSGAMSFAGVNNRYNSFQVDGAMNNDVFGLTSSGQNGGQAGTNPISIETVDQIQVNVAPFDVRQSGFTGGAINAITKSGTNEFHGSAYYYGNNENLIGSRYVLRDGSTSSKYDEQSEYTWGVTLGGPIIKNKLFFFANYEKANKEYPNMWGIDKQGADVKEQAETVMNHMKQYGWNGNFNSPDVYTKSDKVGAKLDWNINAQHHASFRWSLVSARQLNNTPGSTYLDSSDYSYDFVSKTNSFIAELQSKINNELSNELRASYVRVRDSREPESPFPYVQIDLGKGRYIALGNDRSSMANSLNQDIWSITDNLTWLKGNHTFTFGTHDEFYKFSNLFIQDLYGSYYFTDHNGDGTALDEFLAGEVNQFRFQQAVTNITGTASWAPAFGAGQLGFYAQDKWNVNDNLELTLGLRADIPLFFDTPTENPGFNQYAQSRGWNVKTNHKLSSTPMWSPRAGFRWHLADRKVLLRGGLGIFTGRIPFVWLSNNFSNTGIQFESYNITNITQEKYPNLKPIYEADPAKQATNATYGKASGSQTINVFSDDFKFSQNARINLAVETTPFWGIKWTLEGIYSKTLNDILYKNLAYEESGQTWSGKYNMDFDNRPIYAKSTAEGASTYTNIYELSNTSKGYSYSLSLKAEKSFDFGLNLMAAYTYTQSKSLNSGTSSVAASNWSYNYTTGHSNNPELGYSAFNRPHAVKIAATWHKEWLKNYETTISLLYTGESGDPYSIYINGDVNEDGSSGNDLMFIWTDAQIDKMQAAGLMNETTAAGLKGWFAQTDYLKDHRGEYFERYAANKPFEHHFDLHLAQAFKIRSGKMTHKLEISFDVLNIGNMLNKKWGRVYGGSQYYSPVGYRNGVYTFTGGADYDFHTYSDYYSRWRGQIGLKYTF